MTHRMVALILIVLAFTACATSSPQRETAGKEGAGSKTPEAGGSY